MFKFAYTNKQSKTALMIERIYGDIKEIKPLENHNILVTYEFWGDSYSGYKKEIVIDERGEIVDV